MFKAFLPLSGLRFSRSEMPALIAVAFSSAAELAICLFCFPGSSCSIGWSAEFCSPIALSLLRDFCGLISNLVGVISPHRFAHFIRNISRAIRAERTLAFAAMTCLSRFALFAPLGPACKVNMNMFLHFVLKICIFFALLAGFKFVHCAGGKKISSEHWRVHSPALIIFNPPAHIIATVHEQTSVNIPAKALK